MTFQDFLEHFYAALGKAALGPGSIPQELAPLGGPARIKQLIVEAPLFHLDADADEAAFLKEVGQDVLEDLQSTFPVPFDNFAVIQEEGSSGHWQFRWLLRLAEHGTWSDANGLFGQRGQYLLWVYSSAGGAPLSLHSSVRFQYIGGRSIEVLLSPASIDRFARGLGRTTEEAQEALRAIVTGVLLEVGAISHPANYIVERTPALSPREERQLRTGAPRPAKKRSHFIVVDHAELRELNPATRAFASSHASPVPHARRGHWRRLAENCRISRAQGRNKVFVRPAFVGEREFEAGRMKYRVLLDVPQSERAVSGTLRAKRKES